jgi:hypothetical protein
MIQSEKTYLNLRRVTTVEEQQTWEDLEDEYDNSQPKETLSQIQFQCMNTSDQESTLKSFRNSTGENESPEFNPRETSHQNSKMIVLTSGSDDCQENLCDENEESNIEGTSTFESRLFSQCNNPANIKSSSSIVTMNSN